MGWNFRKSVKIAPGVKVNFSKRGASISAGPKGYKVSVNSKGKVHQTTSIPGTGLYNREQIADLSGKKSNKSSGSRNINTSETTIKTWEIIVVLLAGISLIAYNHLLWGGIFFASGIALFVLKLFL